MLEGENAMAMKCSVQNYPTIQKPPSLTLASSIELENDLIKMICCMCSEEVLL